MNFNANNPPARPPYRYKTKPKGRQLETVEETWHEPKWALLARPGTGKTKMGLDTAGLNYMAGRIEALLVIAPNGVHRQWVVEGIPDHLPESIPWMGGFYSSGMGKRKLDHLNKCFLSRSMGLRVLSVSFEGVQTKVGQRLAHDLVGAYRTLVIVDESHRASNIKGGVWKALKAICTQAHMIRIATGTLLRQNPFSAYGQFELMGDCTLGFGSLSSFKSMYAEMLPPENGLVKHIRAEFKAKTGKDIVPQVQAKDRDGAPIYRNLPDLRNRLQRYSSFLTLADVNGVEPTITQCTRLVQLTTEQRRMYDDLKELGVIEFEDRDEILTADTALALATRLAQITGGFVPSDDDPDAQPVGTVNPKLNELLELVEELAPEKVVIWCRYQAELRAVADALGKIAPVVQYHGRCTDKEKAEAKRSFIEDASTRFFVGQVKAGGTGLDGLQKVAQYMVFYSNDYPYLDREQAIARLARTGGLGAVVVYDLMAEESVDYDIVRCLQTAQDVTAKVLQRGLTRKWV